jgi:HMG (high mobility group) box
MQNKKTLPTIKKWSWRKPKGKPKRPLSAYNIFYQEVRQKILEERNCSNEAGIGGIGFRNLTQAVAVRWKDLDSNLKKPYELKAREAKAQYLVDLALWEKSQQKLVEIDSRNASPTSSVLKANVGSESSNVPSLISALYDASHHASNVHEPKESTSQLCASTHRPMEPNPFLSNEPGIDALLASACDMYSEYGLRSDEASAQQKLELGAPLEYGARYFPMNACFSNAWQDLEGNFSGERFRLTYSGNDIYEPLPLQNGTDFNRIACRNLESIAATTCTAGLSSNYERPSEDCLDAACSTALDKLLNMLDNDESFS